LTTAIRLDKYLAEGKYFDSREKAQQAIASGYVMVDDVVITTPSFTVNEKDRVEVKHGAIKYVGKGGFKLEKALRTFNIDLHHKTVIDAGASTGGFTDCALQNGAVKVYAIDVGTSQLHSSLLNHPKVISLENTDIRNITVADAGNKEADFLMADLSFISLTKVLPVFASLVKNGADLLLLVKPQFETERKKKVKKGIIKDEATRKDALRMVVQAASEAGLKYIDSVETDADGKSKNIEYMVWFRK
jgi:23S rRNA (cytidine1920-2'-O)/16S rRNA (cytidine1409-2'-O)-methyltransferase